MSEAETTSLVGRPATWTAPPEPPRLPAEVLYASPLASGSRLQEFEISAVIGQGGFGIVYLARDLSLQRRVAIKEYMPAHLAGRDAEQRVRPLTAGQADIFERGRLGFISEARMLARFKHPGLLEVLRFWEQNGTAYMAMPYYDGPTLTQHLKRHPGIATEAWLRTTLSPLIDALGHMHAEDCFHRDVAPDNILILKDGSAVLLDLGAARRVIADDAQAMTVMLKPGYAPIEQYCDDPRFQQGPWTDIYAMAAVLFFAITGHAPPAAASRVMRDSVSPLSSVRPEGFSESFLLAIDRGLSLLPEDRPRSIAEFRAMLFADRLRQAAAEPSPARAGDAAADGTFPKPRHRSAPAAAEARMAARVGAGVAVLTLLLAGAWYATQPTALPDADQPAATAPPSASPSADPPAVRPAEPAAAAPASDAVAPTSSPRREAPPATAALPSPPAPSPAPEAVKKPAPPATGTLALAVTPWAEVRVDGALRGVSPPMKQLTLTVGPHTIEFRNPAAAPVRQQVEIRANHSTVVRQQF